VVRVAGGPPAPPGHVDRLRLTRALVTAHSVRYRTTRVQSRSSSPGPSAESATIVALLAALVSDQQPDRERHGHRTQRSKRTTTGDSAAHPARSRRIANRRQGARDDGRPFDREDGVERAAYAFVDELRDEGLYCEHALLALKVLVKQSAAQPRVLINELVPLCITHYYVLNAAAR
jgi:hypothetical protein